MAMEIDRSHADDTSMGKRIGRLIALAAIVAACSSNPAATTSSTAEPEPVCDEAVDLALQAAQDFLDRLGHAAAEDLPLLPSMQAWIGVYLDEANGVDRVFAYLNDEPADDEQPRRGLADCLALAQAEIDGPSLPLVTTGATTGAIREPLTTPESLPAARPGTALLSRTATRALAGTLRR